MKYDYVNIDIELLIGELCSLGHDFDRKDKWFRYDPVSRGIESLYKEFECTEFIEKFYNSEPEYDEETFRMYVDYIVKYSDKTIDTSGFVKSILCDTPDEQKENTPQKTYTKKELKEAYKVIRSQQSDHNKKRISVCNKKNTYNNYLDEMPNQADEYSKKIFRQIIGSETDNTNRLWMIKDSENDEKRIVVYYGRDHIGVDYIWCFQKKK